MKKITLMAALLGSAYFANAQVGIGTPTPHASSILEIASENKGVLIPRVILTNTKDMLAGNTAQLESLLVYNTATTTGIDLVTPGFYYWVPLNGSVAAHWERVVNQSQLNEVLDNQADIEKIKILLNAAYGSNNLGDSATTGVFGGMVFTPATGTFGNADYIAPVVEYVKWNSVSGGYEKVNVTAQLIDLIKGNETKTKLVNIGGNTYYISESFVGTEPTTAAAFEIAAGDATSGIYKVDFINGVTKNFQQISTSITNIVKTPANGQDPAVYFTVEEYIQYLSQNSQLSGDTKIVIDATTGKASLQQWNGTAWVAVNNSAFSTIVTDNETKTKITKNSTGTAVDGDLKIDYKYFNEAQPDTNGNPQEVIDLNADLKTLIEGNTEIKNAISNILNAGGNVYYGDHDGSNTTADVFYTIVNGVKTPIEISQVVVNAITNATTIQKQEIKNQLGDSYSTTNVVNTGDTWVDGGKIYKGIYSTIVLAGSANITGGTATTVGSISITAPTGTTLGDVISIKILNGATNSLITESVTDVKLENGNLYFRIGTGTMYNVLSATDLNVKVLVEFSATTTP